MQRFPDDDIRATVAALFYVGLIYGFIATIFFMILYFSYGFRLF